MVPTSTDAGPIYDRIGTGYAQGRRADPRWSREVDRALRDAVRVVDVGAGTGSYEPGDRDVVAVEPSPTMIAQRRPRSAPVVRAVAERLPFGNNVFDVAMAILTVHHWTDLRAGIDELRRVASRQVVLAYDPELHAQFWLCDYLPEIREFERRRAPSIDRLAELLGSDDVRTLPVPADMRDGVLIAHWRRPHAYLDPAIRARCSGLAQLEPDIVESGIARLRADLAHGTWHARYGHVHKQTQYDGGYRLIVADNRPMRSS